MKRVLSFLCFLVLSTGLSRAQDDMYVAERGVISLKSVAPLEIIEFESRYLRGVINPATKSFAFTVSILSFQGFNSEIQRTHFMENYMEQKNFPQATFIGKIIEDIPFNIPGTYPVRAKGELDVHGVKKERIIKGTLVIRNNTAHIQTHFYVPVADHGIAIPKIVKQKIADEIEVAVDIEFVHGSRS